MFIIIMEEDILNYSPTVMFRGTPCTLRERGIYIYTIKTTFGFNLIYIKLLNRMDTHKHRSKEKLSKKKFSL